MLRSWCFDARCGTPALATEWEHCADAGGAASFDYLAGDGPVCFDLGADGHAGEKVWASDPPMGRAIR